MAESEQVIRLSGKEDIHAVRIMLARAQAKRLLIVVPPKHPAFQRLVRLKMLARQAHEESVQIAIVTSDYRIRELAEQVDLSSFSSVDAGRRARRWRGGQAPSAPLNGAGRSSLSRGNAWERGRRAVVERRQQIGTRSNWGESIMLAGLVFGMMIVLSAALLLLLPSAQITLVPRQVPLEVSFPVTVDVNAQHIDYDDSLIPGQLIPISVQGTQEMATSGRRDVPSAHATGSVLFINITGEAVTVPSGTIVTTSAGTPVRFRTTETVSVPAELGGRVSAPIEAISPGPSGNVAPLQINLVEGAAAAAVRVLNESGTQGGDVQQVAVVTAADQSQLLEQLGQRLLQEGRAELERRIAESGTDEEGTGESDSYLVPGTVVLEITSQTFNGSIDDQLDTLRLDLRGRVSGIVISKEDMTRLARRRLQAQVPEGYRMLEDGFNVIPGEAQPGERGLPVMAVRTEVLAGASLSGQEIRTLVRGQPVDEARAALLQRLPLAADPAITTFPQWWDRMPYLPIRIFIRVGVLGAEQPADELLSDGEE